MSIIVHTYFVPRGLSSFAPSHDSRRGLIEVPSGTIDNSPPFLTVGCPHHKTLPVPQPRDERTPGSMVPSRLLPSTGRAIQRPRFLAHSLRSGCARGGFLSSLAGLLPYLTATHRYKRWAIFGRPCGTTEDRAFRRPLREQMRHEIIVRHSTRGGTRTVAAEVLGGHGVWHEFYA